MPFRFSARRSVRDFRSFVVIAATIIVVAVVIIVTVITITITITIVICINSTPLHYYYHHSSSIVSEISHDNLVHLGEEDKTILK